MKAYKLKQVRASQGLNSHREWVDEISGQSVYSNDDVLGDRFYMTPYESSDTIWYETPTHAIKEFIKLGRGAVKVPF